MYKSVHNCFSEKIIIDQIFLESPNVDNQHALLEYDNEQHCFILKDHTSSRCTYLHECHVPNAAVRLADGDFIRFGFNDLPLKFRIEQQQEVSYSIIPKTIIIFVLFFYRLKCHQFILDHQHQIFFIL